jgi:hypothetical integral membrane protein (TIGR02206 family)
MIAYVRLARGVREQEGGRRLDLGLGVGCLMVWLVNTIFWMWPSRFLWESSLPLHYCNMANLLGAAAAFTRRRIFQGLVYFWAMALCVWAFLTPTVRYGPLHAQFWVFWLYHAFIGLAVVHVLVADRFRPTWADLKQTTVFTGGYTAVLIVANWQWGWNYGFVGPSVPQSPTIIDALGPYPLRLVWIVLLAFGMFVLCWLPWCREGRRES